MGQALAESAECAPCGEKEEEDQCYGCNASNAAFASVESIPVHTQPEPRSPRTVDDGATYSGEWLGQRREGQGHQEWPDGSKYDGQWRRDERHGRGTFDHSNGDIYAGEWFESKAHGNGAFFARDGSKYDGQWVDNKQQGQGREEWPDGSTFSGFYDDGVKSGDGVFVWADGTRYEGQMLGNELSGYGAYTRPDKGKFEGQWMKNRMNGDGLFTWEDGKCYKGQYRDDLKHGTGVFTYADGRQYQGQWARGKMNGKGTWRDGPDAPLRVGVWERGHFQKWVDGDDIDMVATLCSQSDDIDMIASRLTPSEDGYRSQASFPTSQRPSVSRQQASIHRVLTPGGGSSPSPSLRDRKNSGQVNQVMNRSSSSLGEFPQHLLEIAESSQTMRNNGKIQQRLNVLASTSRISVEGEGSGNVVDLKAAVRYEKKLYARDQMRAEGAAFRRANSMNSVPGKKLDNDCGAFDATSSEPTASFRGAQGAPRAVDAKRLTGRSKRKGKERSKLNAGSVDGDDLYITFSSEFGATNNGPALTSLASPDEHGQHNGHGQYQRLKVQDRSWSPTRSQETTHSSNTGNNPLVADSVGPPKNSEKSSKARSQRLARSVSAGSGAENDANVISKDVTEERTGGAMQT